MSVYRESAVLPLEPVGPRGLIRKNGAVCRCTAPGWLWCWWLDVGLGDRWYCSHGAGWERGSNPRYSAGYQIVWLSLPSEGKAEGRSAADDEIDKDCGRW